MNRQIISQVLGNLTQHKDFGDWWLSNPVEIPFLNQQKMEFTFMGYEPPEDAAFVPDADEAVRNFLHLTPQYKTELAPLAHQAFIEFYENVDWDDRDKIMEAITAKNDIWHFIHPVSILVSRRHRRDKYIYILLECNCDWDDEHGIHFTFRQGKKLTRIGAYDGHLTEADAYDKPDEEDELLSKFND